MLAIIQSLYVLFVCVCDGGFAVHVQSLKDKWRTLQRRKGVVKPASLAASGAVYVCWGSKVQVIECKQLHDLVSFPLPVLTTYTREQHTHTHTNTRMLSARKRFYLFGGKGEIFRNKHARDAAMKAATRGYHMHCDLKIHIIIYAFFSNNN